MSYRYFRKAEEYDQKDVYIQVSLDQKGTSDPLKIRQTQSLTVSSPLLLSLFIVILGYPPAHCRPSV